jgi:hypothetical protein
LVPYRKILRHVKGPFAYKKRSSSSSLARQPHVGPGLPQKLLPAEVSGYCFFRFRDKSLFQVGVVSPTPNPRLSWRADVFYQGCLHWLTSPSFKASGSRFLPSPLRINVAQEPCRGHACNGLGTNKWHYSSVVSIILSARCVPSGPRTTHSTPIKRDSCG